MEDELFISNLASLPRSSVQELFQDYFYDHEVSSFLEIVEIKNSKLHKKIIESITDREIRSQLQESERMATSSSQATISGIYSVLKQNDNGSSEAMNKGYESSSVESLLKGRDNDEVLRAYLALC